MRNLDDTRAKVINELLSRMSVSACSDTVCTAVWCGGCYEPLGVVIAVLSLPLCLGLLDRLLHALAYILRLYLCLKD